MLDAFGRAMREHGIEADAAQKAAALRLQRFYDELLSFKAARRNGLRKLLIHPDLPRGVWFWGGVGRGKSFLMDCFFGAVPYKRKRRVHFHAFMREVHERLKAFKHEGDPLGRVAAEVAKETRFLCLDDFHVSDLADAMILDRLMEALFDAGVVFCITSNYPPAGLYPNGLQRDRFLPAIALLEDRLDVVEVDAGVDYRMRTLEGGEAYRVPAGAEANVARGHAFIAIAGGEGHDRPLTLCGREVQPVRRAPGIAWFDFDTLCGGPRSQNDYLELAQSRHTVFLSGVPRLGPEMAAEARRLTWLVDVLYDHRVKLVVTADCPAEEIYVSGPQAEEFKRTVSRLAEMRSREYLGSPHRR